MSVKDQRYEVIHLTVYQILTTDDVFTKKNLIQTLKLNIQIQNPGLIQLIVLGVVEADEMN